ncbi:MAG: hypothetical protein EP343_21975 [Deltaproteobacteria bacterium]|nr:MAG: hypothetical protein EP343_21975 [Deltaproteobacteria bacterium]
MAARKRDTGLNDTLDALEKKIDQCRVLYELWFNGVEKREPVWHRQDINRQLTRLRRESREISSPVDRFRFRNIQARFNSLVQYWNRVNLQRERGTYHKDVKRRKRRMGDVDIKVGAALDEKGASTEATQQEVRAHSIDEEGNEDLTNSLEAAAEAAAASQTAQQQQARKQADKDNAPGVAAAARAEQAVSEQRMQQIYRTYLKARERTQESTNVSYDAVARSIHQQIPKLKEKGYNDVDFKVVIRNGKAAIRPVAKKQDE